MPLIATTRPARAPPRGVQRVPAVAAGCLLTFSRGVTLLRGDQAEGQGGPAVGAAHRLGVEAAVGRVVVLGRARPAHREARHRGGGTVVGQPRDDREPRPAVGARDERVPEPAVGGSNSSRRQSSHSATSGGIGVTPSPSRLATMAKPVPGEGGRASSATAAIRASGGAWATSRSANAATAARPPCTSTNTSPAALPTNPESPSSAAMRWTKGRNPTPCTTPVTV